MRAVIIAIEYSKNNARQANYLLKNQNGLKMKNLLKEMSKETGIHNGPCGLQEIKIVDEYLKEYQIMVVNGNCKFDSEPLYINREKNNKKCLYLCLYKNHYYVITSMTSFLNKSYFCDRCKIGFNQLGTHKCELTCNSCCRVKCPKSDYTTNCDYCKKVCFNEVCERIHNETFCSRVAYCKKCDKRKFSNHVCDDEKYCNNCKKAVELTHKCYIFTEQEKQEKSKKRWEEKFYGYIFFDYETYTDNNGIHVPNLIIAKRVCVNCLDLDKLCQECDQIFKFFDNDSFCKWLISNNHYTALAHNLKGYDGTFIANYCINNLTSADAFPEMIATPTKLLQIKFKHLKIIDSFSFLAMALDKFPSTFDIPEMKKGFYPHLFNKPENSDYIGCYPDISFYGSEYFSISKKKEFDHFYESVKDKVFDNKKELEDYCISDVEILATGCLKFRKIIMQQTKLDANDPGVDPFRVSITIASLCNYIFRRNFMKPNTIAVIPENGYNPKQNTSLKCKQWLRFLEKKNDIFIQSADNIGEKRFGQYLLDGFCEQTNTAYEFNGCYWHGCMKCYTSTTWNSVKNFSMGYINKCNFERVEKLKKLLPSDCFPVFVTII